MRILVLLSLTLFVPQLWAEPDFDEQCKLSGGEPLGFFMCQCDYDGRMINPRTDACEKIERPEFEEFLSGGPVFTPRAPFTIEPYAHESNLEGTVHEYAYSFSDLQLDKREYCISFRFVMPRWSSTDNDFDNAYLAESRGLFFVDYFTKPTYAQIEFFGSVPANRTLYFSEYMALEVDTDPVGGDSRIFPPSLITDNNGLQKQEFAGQYQLVLYRNTSKPYKLKIPEGAEDGAEILVQFPQLDRFGQTVAPVVTIYEEGGHSFECLE